MRKGVILIVDEKRASAKKLGGEWLDIERQEVPGLYERIQRMVNDGRATIEHGLQMQKRLPEPDKEFGELLSKLAEETER